MQQSLIDRHLQAVHAQVGENIGLSAESSRSVIGNLLQLDLDILAWEQRIVGRPEAAQLTAARRELGYAIYLVGGGLYLHAYAALRLFLELSFASVYFSANELHRRRWTADREDFSWKKALDEDAGVLSKSFVREFNDSAVNDAAHYAKVVAETYRHCSQFVHGKLAATRALPDTVEFSSLVLADWLSTATSSAQAVLFLLYARYGEELLQHDEDGRLSSTIESSFGHLREVRTRLGLPIEKEMK